MFFEGGKQLNLLAELISATPVSQRKGITLVRDWSPEFKKEVNGYRFDEEARLLSLRAAEALGNCSSFPSEGQSCKFAELAERAELPAQLRFIEKGLSSAQLFLKVTQLSSAQLFRSGSQLSSAQLSTIFSTAQLSFFFSKFATLLKDPYSSQSSREGLTRRDSF